jgi:SAM-dependent methyltransferase
MEIGCGPHGGFVPALLRAGHEAVGIDPEAPEGPDYERLEFELYQPPRPFDAVVACKSLHHVSDLDVVLDRVIDSLVPRGVLVVVESALERFDEKTARWCFARLGAPSTESEHDWLRAHREAWSTSGQAWESYFQGWVKEEGLHAGQEILKRLDERFQADSLTFGPYFFADLVDTSEVEEQQAIDEGYIRAVGIRYSAVAPRDSCRHDGTRRI